MCSLLWTFSYVPWSNGCERWDTENEEVRGGLLIVNYWLQTLNQRVDFWLRIVRCSFWTVTYWLRTVNRPSSTRIRSAAAFDKVDADHACPSSKANLERVCQGTLRACFGVLEISYRVLETSLAFFGSVLDCLRGLLQESVVKASWVLLEASNRFCSEFVFECTDRERRLGFRSISLVKVFRSAFASSLTAYFGGFWLILSSVHSWVLIFARLRLERGQVKPIKRHSFRMFFENPFRMIKCLTSKNSKKPDREPG